MRHMTKVIMAFLLFVCTALPQTNSISLAQTHVAGVNLQTGTSYTILSSDRSKLVSTNNSSPIAVGLPQATGSFTTGFMFWIQNIGAGTATITPTTSTIDGQSSLALTQYQGTWVVSNGTNWYTDRGIGNSATGTVTSVATTSPITGGTITTTGTIACPTCVVATVNPSAGVAHFAGSTQTATSSAVVNADITSLDASTKLTGATPVANGGTGTSSTLTGLVRGGSPMTAAELSGDITTSGSNATTVAKIQGVTVSGTTGTGNAVFSGSPALTGTPTAPTQASNDNSTKIATTAWVNSFSVPTGSLPTWLATDVDAPPTSAGTLDDEFDSGSISGSWTNLSGTASVVNGTVGDSDTVNDLVLVQTQPGTPWEVQAKCVHTLPVSGFVACGVIVRDSAGGKLDLCRFETGNNFNTQNVEWTFFTNITTFSSNNVTAAAPREPYIYLKLKNDGTNLLCSYSWDAIDWINIVSQAKGTFVPTGGDQVGIFVPHSNTTATVGGARFAWFRRTL